MTAQEFSRRMKLLRDRREHIVFMALHGAFHRRQPPIYGFNTWWNGYGYDVEEP